MFQDITTLLLDHKAFKHTIDIFVDRYKDMHISVVAGITPLFFPPYLILYFSLLQQCVPSSSLLSNAKIRCLSKWVYIIKPIKTLKILSFFLLKENLICPLHANACYII